MASAAAPRIFEATLGANGSVRKGAEVDETAAVSLRKSGLDVVVCGDDVGANRRLAGKIEQAASGSYKRCPPHASAGKHALPHCQPDPRPPDGHTFYETDKRKAF
jgi:hypothetical protein